jgi:hypothetical protein
LTEKEASKKYRRTTGYKELLHTLKLMEIDEFLLAHKSNLHHLQIEGYRNLLSGLAEFFEDESDGSIHDDHQIKAFSSVALESTDIVRATSNFHGKSMFSNVIISANDEGGNEVNWYGQVRVLEFQVRINY